MQYNCRIIHYPTGDQIRFYKNPVKKGSNLSDNTDMLDAQFNAKIDNKKHPANKEENLFKSRNRTIQKVYEYARSNVFEWFVTMTFSPHKVDRYDYDACSRKLSDWLKSQRKNNAPFLKYIFVPERHKDGAWHFHGLISDCGKMSFVDSTKKTEDGDIIYNIGSYRSGWTTATKICHAGKASNYITKYITKKNDTPEGKKRYWTSRNLKKPVFDEYMFTAKQVYQLKNNILDSSIYDVGFMKSIENEWNTTTIWEVQKKQ